MLYIQFPPHHDGQDEQPFRPKFLDNGFFVVIWIRIFNACSIWEPLKKTHSYVVGIYLPTH